MLSVVVPIYNEQANLPALAQRLSAALESCGEDWEIIFVDDGSTDGSGELLRQLHQQDPRNKVLVLSRNFGQQPAISAGIHHAAGQCVILIDADLQDPPELIPEMVRQWHGGAQVVLGRRASRKDRGLRGLGFRLFYPLMRWLSDLPRDCEGGIFCLMDRAVIELIDRLPERHRFLPGLRSWLGFRQTTVSYDRQPRAAGRPKQTLRRLLAYAADAIFSFSFKPLRLATLLGFVVSSGAFVLAVWYFVTFFAFHKEAGGGFTTIILCVLFLGGVQLITIGILGEYVGRIYDEVKRRPLYVVAEEAGFGLTPRPVAIPPMASKLPSYDSGA